MIQELKLHQPSPLGIFLQSFDFIRSFFGWWYGDVPLSMFATLRRLLIIINDTTSFGIILKGFFRPWKNDYNIAGWLVGIVIKAVYLPLIATVFIITLVLFMLLLLLQLAILPTVIGLIIINPFLRA